MESLTQSSRHAPCADASARARLSLATGNIGCHCDELAPASARVPLALPVPRSKTSSKNSPHASSAASSPTSKHLSPTIPNTPTACVASFRRCWSWPTSRATATRCASSIDGRSVVRGRRRWARTLGDYRLIREVGRGGMGIVYEAEQMSLGRRVALKILPFASVLDPRHLQRFKNEALAAAHLDHPNIVEVYGVGCERGIHFYAMRFVDGVTLADVIAGMQGSESLPDVAVSLDSATGNDRPDCKLCSP